VTVLSLSFPKVSYLERFGLAASCGFRAVESLFPYDAASADAVAVELRNHDLQQVLVNAPPGDWANGDRGIGGIASREAEHEASVSRAMAYAKTIGCPRIHVLAGLKAQGATEDTFIARLRALAPVAEVSGIRLCVEALNSHDVPDYLIPTQEDAARIVDAVGHPGCGLQFDLYHLQMMKGVWPNESVREAIKKFGPIAAHVQIAGPNGRHEPDEAAAVAMLDLLEQSGYTGHVGCEYKPVADVVQGLVWARSFGITAPEHHG